MDATTTTPGARAPRELEPAGGRPKSVLHAARIMAALALINLVALIVLLLTMGEVRRLLRTATPPPSAASVTAAIAVTIIGYVASVVLFALLTRHVTQGRNWARITTWLVAGIGIVTTVQRLGRHQPSPSRALDVIAFLLDVAVVALLAARPSNRWFRPR